MLNWNIGVYTPILHVVKSSGIGQWENSLLTKYRSMSELAAWDDVGALDIESRCTVSFRPFGQIGWHLHSVSWRLQQPLAAFRAVERALKWYYVPTWSVLGHYDLLAETYSSLGEVTAVVVGCAIQHKLQWRFTCHVPGPRATFHSPETFLDLMLCREMMIPYECMHWLNGNLSQGSIFR